MDATAKPLKLPTIDKAIGKTLLQLPKVKAYLDMIVEGEDAKTAALACGIKVNRARSFMLNADFRRAFHARCDVLKAQERARNIRATVEIRDRAFDKQASAADRKTALEAVRMLDGDGQSTSITINGPGAVIAGYVIKLDGPSEGPRAISNRSVIEHNPLKSLDVITDDDV